MKVRTPFPARTVCYKSAYSFKAFFLGCCVIDDETEDLLFNFDPLFSLKALSLLRLSSGLVLIFLP